MRTIGVEEEFLLVDPATGRVAHRADAVLRGVDDLRHVDRELLRHQVETRTEPTADLADTRAQLVAARRCVGEAARDAGVAAVATGTSPFGASHVEVSPKDRYRALFHEFGEISREAGTCGMHVHVEISSREEGVGIIDRLHPWLPLVLALSVNSPYIDGRDSGYASWRTQIQCRWPTAGATEAFGDLAAYDALVADLMAVGAARDTGMVYFEARLSEAQPTVEVRVADVCTDPDDALLVAAVVRALAATAATDWSAGRGPAAWRSELLRAAAWRASRYGPIGKLVHPLDRDLQPARHVLAALVDQVRPALHEAGDLDLVTAGLDRVLAATGAAHQRAAYERSGNIGYVVADLVRRTEGVWRRA